MKRNLACARAEEAAEWLQGYDPDDGHGAVGDQAADPASMFTQPVVIAAFIAGAEKADDLAEAEFAIERAVGQRQLDEASALIMEASALFLGYGEHHQARADEFEKSGDVEACAASLRKARVNMSMAVSLREWLSGDVQGMTCPHCRGRQFARVDEAKPGGGFGPGPMLRCVSCKETLLVPIPAAKASQPNIKPVTSGHLADPVVIESLIESLGGPVHCLSAVKAGAFRLQTPDPRFDPARPVCVNGFLYTPATEG